MISRTYAYLADHLCQFVSKVTTEQLSDDYLPKFENISTVYHLKLTKILFVIRARNLMKNMKLINKLN